MLSHTSNTIEDIVVAPLLNRVCRDQKESPVARKLEIKRNKLIYMKYGVKQLATDSTPCVQRVLARDIGADLLCFGAILIQFSRLFYFDFCKEIKHSNSA